MCGSEVQADRVTAMQQRLTGEIARIGKALGEQGGRVTEIVMGQVAQL